MRCISSRVACMIFRTMLRPGFPSPLACLLVAAACSSPDPAMDAEADTADSSRLAGLERGKPAIESAPPRSRRVVMSSADVDAAVMPGFENPMIETSEERISGFSLDANTASYALARTALQRGELPDPLDVRTEEFVNRFEYRNPPPQHGDFAMHVEAAPSPYRPDYHMLRFGIRARDTSTTEREPAFMVFVVDASNSMDKNGHLHLIQDGLRTLAARLGPHDRLGIVTYGHRAQVVLEPTNGSQRADILSAIDAMRADGVSNLDAGLALAAEIVGTASGPSHRRIIVCSDGVPNASSLVASQLMTRVAEIAKDDVRVSTVGVGLGNYSDALLEQLSVQGKGLHAYVDRREEVRRVFAENLTGTPQVVARYAKVQVEFEPRSVARFRRLGYEQSRTPPDHWGTDDGFEGAIGAGHSVTALYEVQLHPDVHDGDAPPLLGTVRVRYHDRDDRVRMLEQTFARDVLAGPESPPSSAIQLALVAAVFAEKLRNSYWAHHLAWDELVQMWSVLPSSTRRWVEVGELGELIRLAAERMTTSPPPKRRLVFERIAVLK